jgi:predicted DNA-binding helix-hairpin-helix protein
MNFDRITEKLEIVAEAAKYDVACSSSGAKRNNQNKGL